MVGTRLHVSLAYASNDTVDEFDWQLFTPTELMELLEMRGLQCLVACTDFDETKPASANSPRVQYIFEKAI